jgi:hypothetical protein
VHLLEEAEYGDDASTSNVYEVPHAGPCMHEFVASARTRSAFLPVTDTFAPASASAQAAARAAPPLPTISTLALGSVTERVVRTSPIPVLVIPTAR